MELSYLFVHHQTWRDHGWCMGVLMQQMSNAHSVGDSLLFQMEEDLPVLLQEALWTIVEIEA
jgi:capsule polysaccharide modification protein KpsS